MRSLGLPLIGAVTFILRAEDLLMCSPCSVALM
jgi:hypothetical protein